MALALCPGQRARICEYRKACEVSKAANRLDVAVRQCLPADGDAVAAKLPEFRLFEPSSRKRAGRPYNVSERKVAHFDRQH